MGVYIKGAWKPADCDGCYLNHFDECDATYRCFITDTEIKNLYKCNADCPIIEVPSTHGDLIDKDNIKEIYLEDSLDCMTWNSDNEVDLYIEADTIIEKEE